MGECAKRLSKINTLEEALKQFGMPGLLEKLDINLELVRKNKEETKEKHEELLRSFDKDLLKLSRIYHPDKANKENKSDEGMANADNMQITLNATRFVLKALTEAFLKDIDVHYKYEFFSKMDINTLSNEEQIEFEIDNVLCKISRLSEIKRVDIVGEIRNFLMKCGNSLESFCQDIKFDFVWHRQNAFNHLRKCMEGYEKLLVECDLIVKECSDEKDENTRKAIEKINGQCQIELVFLRKLEVIAKRSLKGTFDIFPIDESWYSAEFLKSEFEYFVSPFVFYVDILLMCSVMLEKKSSWINFPANIVQVLDYVCGFQPVAPSRIFEEPSLLKAYHLAYSYDKNYYEEGTREILRERGHDTVESNTVREVFKQIVEEIKEHLAQRFDINSYKEGKSNREQFNERLLELNDSVTEFKEKEKNLLEKFKLYEQETKEYRKEYSKVYEKVEKTQEEFRKTIPKCENSIENVEKMIHNQNELTGNSMINLNNVHDDESYAGVKDICIENKSIKNIEDQGEQGELERKLKEREKNINVSMYNENVSNSKVHPSNSSYRDGRNPISEDGYKKHSGQNLQNMPRLEASHDIAVTDKTVQNFEANNPIQRFSAANETARTIHEQCLEFPQQHNKNSKVDAEDEENNCLSIAGSEEIRQVISPQTQHAERTSEDGASAKWKSQTISSYECAASCDKNSEVYDEGIGCFETNQPQKLSINFQVSELASEESDRDFPKISSKFRRI